MRRWTIVLTVGLVAVASACSGPHTQEIILYNDGAAVIGAGLSALLTFFAFRRGLRVARVACLVLLLIHPAWTVGSCCDCGMAQTTLAVLDGAISVGVFIWDIGRRRERR